jgi:hypothetical protein
MKRMTVGVVVVTMMAAVAVAGLVAQDKPAIDVYKDPTCGCCAKWVEHLKQQGFATKITEVPNVEEIKNKSHVPRQARSCHTALVGGYAIEGHVPAADIQRLLKERPAGIIGLAVPGMPIGSPGMEVGNRVQPYNVLAFDKDGNTRVFASHGQ